MGKSVFGVSTRPSDPLLFAKAHSRFTHYAAHAAVSNNYLIIKFNILSGNYFCHAPNNLMIVINTFDYLLNYDFSDMKIMDF